MNKVDNGLLTQPQTLNERVLVDSASLRRNFVPVKKLIVDLKNSHGIKSLAYTFDFEEQNRYAIYAPNGSMKSSLALTFKDYVEGNKAEDKRYPTRTSFRSIKDESNVDIPTDGIVVIIPYDDKLRHTEKTSLLLVNSKLSEKYDALIKKNLELEESLVKKLKEQSGTKKDIRIEVSSSITPSDDKFYEALERVKGEVERMEENPRLLSVPYDDVFDDRVLKILVQPEFRDALTNYISKFGELLDRSLFFRRGVFEYYNASQIAKTLTKNGFFEAKHSVILKGPKNEEVVISTEKELEGLVKKEKDGITDDPILRTLFTKLEKVIEATDGLRDFKKFLVSNQDLVAQLSNIKQFKEDVWKAVLKSVETEYDSLLKEKERIDAEKKAIEATALNESGKWEEVIGIFKERFVVPFEVIAENKTFVSLTKDKLVKLRFEFKDGTDKASVDEDTAQKTLSQGERKALYILNIIFEVQCRLHEGKETIFIFDDIADSFDYQNKYAILQYLNDIADGTDFRLLILTHNFDFFRSVHMRDIASRTHCLMALNSNNGDITLEASEAVRGNNFSHLWKPQFYTNNKYKIASIPFVRNLIELEKDDDADYVKLTSLLHWKPDTASILESDLDELFKRHFPDTDAPPVRTPNGPVAGIIFDEAEKCLLASRGINFENKIILSIAIRLSAEKFMVSKITNTSVGALTKNPTQKLIKEFANEFPSGLETIKTLRAVALMTPENIHLNSFMYEPILDMDDQHLRDLYRDVNALK